MFGWSVTFFVFALIAAFFGFGGIALTVASIAKMLFALFFLLFIISFFIHVADEIAQAADRELEHL